MSKDEGAILKAKWATLAKVKLRRATGAFFKDLFFGRFKWVLLILLALGFLLHELRNLYFKAAPWMIKHSTGTTATINFVIFDFYAMIDLIKVLIAAVKEALHEITLGRFPHKLDKLKDIGEPPFINVTTFRQSLKETTAACHDVHSGWRALEMFVRSKTSTHVCPLLRAATPMGRFGEVLHTVGAPLSYDPLPQGNNCAPGKYDAAMAAVCFATTSGLVILEVVLPLVLAAAFLRRYLSLCVEAAWLSILTSVYIVKHTLALAVKFL